MRPDIVNRTARLANLHYLSPIELPVFILQGHHIYTDPTQISTVRCNPSVAVINKDI